MAMARFTAGDPKNKKTANEMRAFMGPHAVDTAIRHAISTCWMMLPDSKKDMAALEAEIRRVFERAIDNAKQDAEAFGIKLKKRP
jgi:hypothetical protein